MKIAEVVDQFPSRDAGTHVYGEPYQTPDGATVITVARVRGDGSGKTTASPVGALVVRDGDTRWVPIVDANRVAVIGVTTGLLAAVIASLAVLRRPPWPDLRGRRLQGP